VRRPEVDVRIVNDQGLLVNNSLLTRLAAYANARRLLPGVIAEGAEPLAASNGNLVDDPTIIARFIAREAIRQQPLIRTVSAVSSGANVVLTLTPAAADGDWDNEVFGIMLDIDVPQNVGNAVLNSSFACFDAFGALTAITFTLQPPVVGPSGRNRIRVVVFGSRISQGGQVYVPFSFRQALSTTGALLTPHNAVLTITAPPTGMTFTLTLLTRGTPLIDELVREIGLAETRTTRIASAVRLSAQGADVQNNGTVQPSIAMMMAGDSPGHNAPVVIDSAAAVTGPSAGVPGTSGGSTGFSNIDKRINRLERKAGRKTARKARRTERREARN
jgi:hypothetical protein